LRLLWKHVGLAALVLAAATAVRIALDPFLGSHLPYVTFFVAIVFLAWRTSTPVAVASTAAGWLVVNYFFIPPRGAITFHFEAVSDWVGSVAYFVVAGTIVLIADRMRRAQLALERSEHQLKLIGERLPALVSYISPALKYVWCNDEYMRWFGLEHHQIVGHAMEEVLGTEAWRTIGPRIDRALSGQFVEYEAEVPYAHGGMRWVHVTYTPHRGTDGAVLGVVAMVIDISDRKRVDLNAALLADLSQAFARLPSVHEAARNVSEQLVQRLGLSRCLLGEVDPATDTIRIFHQHSHDPEPSQAGDYRISDFLTDTERKQLDEGRPLVINDVREGRGPDAAARFLSLGIGAVVSAPYVVEGSRRFALAAEKSEPYAWKPDEVELLREVAARIYVQLDRSRADQALRESERRHRSLASVLTDIPCSVDPDGRFVTPQPTWSRYTGQTFEMSRDFGWLEAVHPEDREPVRVAWLEASRIRGPYETRARLWQEASGQFRHVIARATPLCDESGAVREWVGACTDVHEETEQARALIAADRRKDEFLATLAHELRNPLAPIRNGLYILKLTGMADGTVAGVYQMLDRQVTHLVRLVDDLMEVSRITRGRVELCKERTDARSIVENAIETSRPLIDAAGHRLEIDLPAVPLWLDADPMRLAQAVTNLLNNAAKFTDAGGHIRIGARRQGGEVAISVRDDGGGIAPDLLPRVFDLFAQAPGHHHGKAGLGIGLTLVRSMVELHGGTVEARSEGLQRGSEFILRLPLAGASAATSAGPHGATADVLSRRVLIVDDNRDAADSLGVLLALLGVESRTAHDGPAALVALDEFRPSAILLDVGMPRMDGCEVAQRLRQHPAGRDVTLVALSGFGQERDRQHAVEAGFDHHLVKPLDIEALRQLLTRLPAPAGQARRA
jgi:PAS domain S-box-containing protein